ncbi:phage tail protein [Bacillus infantis]|uniref:phage tail-collar fiber domain-containing protein n=1 Tax=Bacillus infantis TaxID=324767 RepID=UPI003CF74AED
MAEYKGIILTAKGRALVAKTQAGLALHFTKAKLGDGEVSQEVNLEELNDLISPKLDLPITHIQADKSGMCHIRTNITNAGLSQGFFVREVGIFAFDETGEEILYAVTTANNADYIPPAGGSTAVNNEFDITVVIGTTSEVKAEINPLGVVSKVDFDEHLEKTDTEAHPEAIRNLNPSAGATGGSGTLSDILNSVAYIMKSITGKENWWEAASNSIEQLDRNDKRIMLQLEVDGRAPGSNGSFLDTIEGTPNRMIFDDAAADMTQPAQAGATTLSIDMVSGTFFPKTQVTIEDDVNHEEVFITSVGENTLNVAALVNDYQKGARISRSSVIRDSTNGEIRIGEWVTYTILVSEGV